MMNNPLKYLVIAASVVLYGFSAHAAPSQCQTVKDVDFLIKADISNHIPRGDVRSGTYSVIGSRQNCRPCRAGGGKCEILYSNGQSAGFVGYYGSWSSAHGGNNCDRSYGGVGGAARHSASAIIKKARRIGGKLYLRSGKTCYQWTASSRRVGHT